MKIKIEAQNLQDAYMLAARELDCSAADIQINIISAPRNGIFGLFKRQGVFEATANVKKEHNERGEKDFRKDKKKKQNSQRAHKQGSEREPKAPKLESSKPEAPKQENVKQEAPKSEPKVEEEQECNEVQNFENAPDARVRTSAFEAYDSIVDNFNKGIDEKAAHNQNVISDETIGLIKDGLTKLFQASSFAIEVAEVSKYDDKTVFIKLDGEDCALLIGKEGYRYKAISYLLFNWINAKFGLNIRLEIAEFLKNQETAVSMYLASVIQKIETTGKGHTKALDGVLVKIALEQLRAKFPNKYVGIKSGEDGRYVVVNDFFKK